MKMMVVTLLALIVSSLSFAAGGSNVGSSGDGSGAVAIVSDNQKALVNIARVTQLVTLVNKPGIQVGVAVQDLGGSTDVSPTQKLFFTLYSKGEMFSTQASFDLGDIWRLRSALRLSGGMYQIDADVLNAEGEVVKRVMTIDAKDAVTAIQAVRCDDFDCQASQEFKSTIYMTTK